MLTMDGMGAARIRGLLPAVHLQWVRDYYGERVAIRVLSILPPEAAVEVNGAIPSGWCSFESLLLLDVAITEVCGRDARQTYRDLGRYTAHVGLTDTERAMIRSDVHRFLRCFAVRDALFQDRGTCRYAQDGPARGMVIADGAHYCIGISESRCRGIERYARAVCHYQTRRLLHTQRQAWQRRMLFPPRSPVSLNFKRISTISDFSERTQLLTLTYEPADSDQVLRGYVDIMKYFFEKYISLEPDGRYVGPAKEVRGQLFPD